MSTSINLPQLLAVLLISGVIIRYFFFSSPSRASSTRDSFPGSPVSAASRRGRAADPRNVEQIAQMFPQVGRREITWDLQRNGGSVAATSERILSGAGLERPPPSFQSPSYPSVPTPSASTSSSLALPQQDLIQRYKLSSKISQYAPQLPPESVSDGRKVGWSANKNERAALLQRRREEMILSARRKLEERDRVGKRVVG